jgi:hypothetical protein
MHIIKRPKNNVHFKDIKNEITNTTITHFNKKKIRNHVSIAKD